MKLPDYETTLDYSDFSHNSPTAVAFNPNPPSKTKSTLPERRRARKAYEKVRKTSKPGEGKRFAAVAKSAKLGGAENPEAVAAAIGRAKYGKAGFQKMAAAGKKRA